MKIYKLFKLNPYRIVRIKEEWSDTVKYTIEARYLFFAWYACWFFNDRVYYTADIEKAKAEINFRVAKKTIIKYPEK